MRFLLAAEWLWLSRKLSRAEDLFLVGLFFNVLRCKKDPRYKKLIEQVHYLSLRKDEGQTKHGEQVLVAMRGESGDSTTPESISLGKV